MRAGLGVRSVIAVSRAAVSDTRTAWLWGVGNPVFGLRALVGASSTNPRPEPRLQEQHTALRWDAWTRGSTRRPAIPALKQQTNSRCGRPRGVGRRLPRRRALARAPFRRGRRRRDFGNESAVNSIDASTARRDERLRRCHRPVCTWIMRVGARHRTWSASAPRLAGRRPTPL